MLLIGKKREKKGTRVLISKSIGNIAKSKRSNSRFEFPENNKMLNSKRSQITIFIIIAIILIAVIGLFFALRGKLGLVAIPEDFKSIEEYFLGCVDSNAETGINILGQQAGYIYLPNFEPGSDFSPFSNQLDFNGLAIPYWYYVSGNNIVKEQAPSKLEMEKQLGKYLEENFVCDFSVYKDKGFDINLGEIKADVNIFDNKLSVSVNADLDVSKGDESARISSHKQEVSSSLGKLYNTARKIYNKEKKDMFLENYSLDVLYLYTPVYGVNISCSPLIWNPYNVFDDLKTNLENNIASIKIKGSYYEKSNAYFVQDLGENLDIGVNFIYDRDFASRFEVWPTRNNIMIAEPVGIQEGLGILGFCYVPYKFVYDMYFPVLVRVYSQDEAFQFPVAVVVSKNTPRESIEGEALETQESICDNANTELNIYTYNVNLEPVEADIEFRCLNDVCSLGKTKLQEENAVLKAEVPQCVNSILVVNAEGYKEKEYTISTNQENIADVILDKEYSLSLEIYVDNIKTENMAVLSISESLEGENKFLNSVAYPYKKEVKLGEGDYKFDLKVYKNSKINLPESKKKECVQVPRTGLLGVFGFSDEKCFDVTIPSQTISNMVYAGGVNSQYIAESQLENAFKLKVYASSVQIPGNIEQLPDFYNSIENKNIRVELE